MEEDIFPMELNVHFDFRRSNPTPDHVCIRGDFGFIKHATELENNCWLKFTLTMVNESDGCVFPVIFRVTRENDHV